MCISTLDLSITQYDLVLDFPLQGLKSTQITVSLSGIEAEKLYMLLVKKLDCDKYDMWNYQLGGDRVLINFISVIILECL